MNIAQKSDITFSNEDIKMIFSKKGKGFTKTRLASWGISWPPKRGWRTRLKKEIQSKSLDQDSKAIIDEYVKMEEERIDSIYEEMKFNFLSENIQIKTTIYTDGCRKKDGNGGWCAIIERDGSYIILGGYKKGVTNNQMEIMPLIESLETITDEGVLIISDSQYVVNSFNDWMYRWKRLGWRRSKNPDSIVKNLEMWQTLYTLKEKTKAKAKWVRGHAGHEFNEACDLIANFCCFNKLEINQEFMSIESLRHYAKSL